MSTAVAELNGQVDLSTVPGAMQHSLLRELDDGGLIEFEQAPAGWLKKDGEPRKADWRAYFYTPPDDLRVRFPSTTTVLEPIFNKGGLPIWAEARGIEGLLLAIQAGAIDPAQITPEIAIKAVRALKLGADAAKKAAADRGLNVHAINEHYMKTGAGPKFADHPRHHHGFIRAWAKATRALDPEPQEVEQLVVHPEHGYAGRLDMRAIVGGHLETDDYKTQTNAAIYPSAHYQVDMYEEAAVRCGAEPATYCRVIVLAEDGEWDSMLVDRDPTRLAAALAHYKALKPIDALCNSRNEKQKAARR